MLVLKLMLNTVMYVDDNSLLMMTDNLQILRIKGIPKNNPNNTVSYLRGYLVLFQIATNYPQTTDKNNGIV